ncbi:MAG: protein kinase [Gammaproteobacteria bacterium]|nr:protein kinase [Gammaproteobacteria bacterium]
MSDQGAITIPGYTLLRLIGSGGMADVHLARQESLGRDVALKILSPAMAADPVLRERFLQEARYAAKLHHPNIIAIYDVGTSDGTAYIAMEYEEKGTVAPPMGAALDSHTALRIVHDIAGALDYAHAQGLVHRDVKPDNILRRANGSCLLSDFGIARAMDSDAALTREGTSIGTPQYMSPEQLRGEKIDGRSDLYSLGVVLYQLLTGELPYKGTDGWAIGVQHISGDIPRLPPALSRLQPLIDALMAKDPNARPASGSDVQRRIDALGTITAPTAVMQSAQGKAPTRRWLLWAAAAAVVLAVLAMMFINVAGDAPLLVANEASPAASAAPAAASAAPAQARTIAVMPFLNMSNDADQEYFSDGMTEELLNALAKVPGLNVTARTSVFSLKGQRHDVRELGKLLGVAYILEGSVRQADGKVRITAQLVRADNGFHLWSETYDRKLEDVFALQAELAGTIAQQLKLPLGMGGSDGLVTQRTTNSQAYALYLQARAAFKARGDGVKQSIDLYRQAVRLDPKFAPAWAGLSASLGVLPYWLPDDEAKATTPKLLGEAEAAARQALQLAPDLAEAHTALASAYAFQWKWKEAEPHFKRALELAPRDPDVYFEYAKWLGGMGRLEESLQANARAVELDPLTPMYLNGQGFSLRVLGRSEEEVSLMQAAYGLAPEMRYIAPNLFAAYLESGRLDDAEKFLDERRPATVAAAAQAGYTGDPQAISRAALQLKRHPELRDAVRKTFTEPQFRNVLFLIGDLDAGLAAIEVQLDARTTGTDPVRMLRSVHFGPYKKDPRWVRLMRKAGFDAEGNLP